MRDLKRGAPAHHKGLRHSCGTAGELYDCRMAALNLVRLRNTGARHPSAGFSPLAKGKERAVTDTRELPHAIVLHQDNRDRYCIDHP